MTALHWLLIAFVTLAAVVVAIDAYVDARRPPTAAFEPPTGSDWPPLWAWPAGVLAALAFALLQWVAAGAGF